jgi:FkbM family methyltransferase
MPFFLLTKKAGEAMSNRDTDVLLEYQTFFENKHVFLLPTSLSGNTIDKGLHDGHIIDLILKHSVDHSKNKIFVDVGAHTGTYTVALAPHFRRVYSYEPQRTTFHALCGSVALNGLRNVHCIRKALGSDEQRGRCTTLYVRSEDGRDSTIVAQPSLEKLKKCLQVEGTEVTTLDTCPEFADARRIYEPEEYASSMIGFIKVDIQGNELECLKGAMHSILKSGHPPILFTSDPGTHDSTMAHRNRLFEFIRRPVKEGGLGYQLIRSVPQSDTLFLATTVTTMVS